MGRANAEVKFASLKLGSDLGQLGAENGVKPRSETQNQAKRINEIVSPWLLRDQLASP